MSASAAGVRSGRLIGVDLARCLALLGMMATHVLGKWTPAGEVTATYALAGGRASALFAVLAGVSLALATGGTTPPGRSTRHWWQAGLASRACLIALVGLVLGELDTGVAVILAHYGVLFLLALPFLGLHARSLAVLAGAWVVVVPIAIHPALAVAPEFDGRSPVLDDLADPGRLLTELLLTGTYPVLPWLAFALAGLALGRSDLTSPRTWRWCVAGGAGLALLAVAVSRAFTAQPWVRRGLGFPDLDHDDLLQLLAGGTGGTPPAEGSWHWLLVVAPHSATPLDLAHTIGCAVAVTGACLAAAALPEIARRGVAVLFGAGAVTLTAYTLHLVMRTAAVWPPEEPGTYRWHVLAVLVLGALAVAAGVRGPLEAVVGAPLWWLRHRGHIGSPRNR